MSELTEREEGVARHYDDTVFEYELARLPEHSPAEYAITCRYLDRHIPAGAVVADIGVGGGYYAERLARRGCSLHLVDVAQRLLDATANRLRAGGLEHCVLGIHRASATQVDNLPAGCCDAVLCLGPLYHLLEPEQRTQAVREAVRVLRPGGLFFAAAINRLAYLRDSFRLSPQRGAERRTFRRQFLQDGNLTPDVAPPLGFAHLSTVEELRALCNAGFDEVALVGVDSFTQIWGPELTRISADDVDAWLELVEQTGATPEGLGMSDHFLYIGRSKD